MPPPASNYSAINGERLLILVVSNDPETALVALVYPVVLVVTLYHGAVILCRSVAVLFCTLNLEGNDALTVVSAVCYNNEGVNVLNAAAVTGLDVVCSAVSKRRKCISKLVAASAGNNYLTVSVEGGNNGNGVSAISVEYVTGSRNCYLEVEGLTVNSYSVGTSTVLGTGRSVVNVAVVSLAESGKEHALDLAASVTYANDLASYINGGHGYNHPCCPIVTKCRIIHGISACCVAANVTLSNIYGPPLTLRKTCIIDSRNIISINVT